MKRPPLHRLKSGEWIDIATAHHISAHSAHKETKLRPRVSITFTGGFTFVEFLTLKSAQAYADELAEIRNSYDLET